VATAAANPLKPSGAIRHTSFCGSLAEIARGRLPGGCGTLLGLDRLGFCPMLRRCSCVIALAVMLVALPTAQAADTTLTLACKGTETSEWGSARKSSEVVNISWSLVCGCRSDVKA
jgi:hypothetical protein